MHSTPRLLASLSLLSVVLPGSGCVFWRIEDQLESINATTAKTSARLDDVASILNRTNQNLDTTNATLAAVQTQLDNVKRTNDLLLDLQFGLGTQSVGEAEAVEKRKSVLETLNTIDTSLGKLDEHLASLRRTLENIDSTIPFIGFADPADDEPALDAEGNPIVDPNAPPPDPGAPTDPAAADPSAPEPAPQDPPATTDNPEGGAPPSTPAPASDPENPQEPG